MSWRNVAFIGTICITIGWLLASTLTPPVVRVQTRPPAPVAQEQTAAPTTPATEQLRTRLEQLRPSPEGRRNPFAFAATPRAASATSAGPDQETPEQVEVAPVVTGPTFVLAGIGISGDERTAVLASPDAVNIVRVDDVVGQFIVTAITDTSVILYRGDEQFVLRLAH